MSDYDNAVTACRAAVYAESEIDDATARVIASMYHSGQASVSYSFASTGFISDPTDVYRDCFPAGHRPYEESGDMYENLFRDMLGTYLMNRADRSAVPGWNRLWL